MRIALAMMLTLLLASCGAAATPATDSGTAIELTQPPAATTGPEATAPAQGGSLPAGSVELAAAQALAPQIGVALETLQLSSKEPQEWSDSSLGCPDPATMYMQVITPGYKLTFTDGANTYQVHTDESGRQAVLCENGAPKSLPGSGGATNPEE